MSETIAPVLSFTLKRTIDAPVEAVWNAWADPEMVKQWWGPDGFTAPVCRMDFREGGTTLVSMKAPDFGEIFNTLDLLANRAQAKHRIRESVRGFPTATRSSRARLACLPGFRQKFPMSLRSMDLGDGRTEMSITESGYTSQQVLEMSKAGQEQVVNKLAASVEKPRG